ncbi:nuclear transport factor 2 family protein [Nocardia fluminea]|uniref:nuclear transport factor 2 family protein n=1 Tax=Nocardia fluminea TaxID=134984 RepID=UPI003713BB7F
MTPVDRVAEDYVDTIRRACSAATDHDVERALRHFDDGCVFVDATTGGQGGKAEAMAFLNEMFTMFPDYSARVVAAHADGDTVAAAYEITGTLSGPEGSTTGRRLRWLTTTLNTFDPRSRACIREIFCMDTSAFEQMLLEARSA